MYITQFALYKPKILNWCSSESPLGNVLTCWQEDFEKVSTIDSEVTYVKTKTVELRYVHFTVSYTSIKMQ